jgi:hypothetical protein
VKSRPVAEKDFFASAARVGATAYQGSGRIKYLAVTVYK